MKILFFIVGFLYTIFKILKFIILESIYIIIDLLALLLIVIKNLFWFLVRLGRKILKKPYKVNNFNIKIKKRSK